MIEVQNTLARFDPFRATIAKYKAEDASLVFDLEDEQGMKDAKGYVKELRGITTAIANVHKEVKADALAFGRSVDRLKNEATDEVNKMINPRANAIKAVEEREYRRMAQEAADRQAEIDRKEAERVAALEAREAAIAEKERIAKEEDDRETRERAARIAEENARMAAENEKLRAAQAKLEEEKRALEAKQLAEEEAQRRVIEAQEAERRRIQEEKEAEAAEKLMQAEIEAKRVANVKHREKIEKEVCNALHKIIEQYDDHTCSFNVMVAIRDGKIPNVHIVY